LLFTASVLRGQGFRVQEFRGGEELLRHLATSTPDLVILDALMPQLDGFATCERLRALPGCELIPVLMLTGLDDEASIDPGL
jgi:DNA-binding response OmpR family regulator